MQTRLVTVSALAIALPAIPAGAAPHVPAPAPAVLSRPGIVHVPRPRSTAVAQTPTSGSTAHGSITLEARQLQGAEAISVAGSAPAGAQVTITLLATVSPDVPTILVSRHDVASDATGRFGAVIPIASAYERGTLLTIVATSAPNVASASAHLVTDAPNAGASIPLTNH